MRRKHVYILVGPKGSGKTHVGAVLERHRGIRFLRVEKLLIEHLAGTGMSAMDLDRHGFPVEEEAIDDMLTTREAVLVESTGSSPHFPGFLENLRRKYVVRLIRIRCPLHTCFERVTARGPSEQLPVSDDQGQAINEIAACVQLNWDLEIDNSKPASDEEIASSFRDVIPLN